MGLGHMMRRNDNGIAKQALRWIVQVK